MCANARRRLANVLPCHCLSEDRYPLDWTNARLKSGDGSSEICEELGEVVRIEFRLEQRVRVRCATALTARSPRNCQRGDNPEVLRTAVDGR